ncbi:MAG: hypothetical protein JWL84_3972 [Rhodospirillales bacterium]|jgi:hypothetical protein|nr:hypothetical protein [Rhodospirillales bacterium]
MIHVISFDAAKTAMSERIGDWIRRYYDSYANPIPGTWIVDGPLMADQIYAGVRPLLHLSDRVLIIKAGMEAIWHGVSEEDAEWLAANFPGSPAEPLPPRPKD